MNGWSGRPMSRAAKDNFAQGDHSSNTNFHHELFSASYIDL
jgi:hypothetical protein